MRAVNTVSLNGNAWQIESQGCEALAAYLGSAEARLASDPDREEILADLEQAIADKLARHVNAHKNVVSAVEVTQVLAEMGPVETPGGSIGSSPAAPESAPPSEPGVRQLYRIREGAMLSGVCRGLAAYFGVDVTLVRVFFAVFATLTAGIGAAVYFVMMFVVPVAVTSEQVASAHGKPFNAEELIGRARAAYSSGPHWRQQWRNQRRAWRRSAPGSAPLPPLPASGYGPRHGGGILQAVLLIVFLVALVHAASGKPVLGWDWTADVPIWLGIVAVCVLYGTLAQQLKVAHYYGQVAVHHPGQALLALVGTMVWLLLLGTAGWYAVHHWPQVQDFVQRALQALQDALNTPPAETGTA